MLFRSFILCSNMRYRAMQELNYTEVPIRIVELTEEQKKELIIKDNISYGEWDEQELEMNWDMDKYNKWLGYEQFDYSALDYTDLSGVIDGMTDGVKKAIKMDFGSYIDEAKQVIKKCREQQIYIGGVFLKTFKHLV